MPPAPRGSRGNAYLPPQFGYCAPGKRLALQRKDRGKLGIALGPCGVFGGNDLGKAVADRRCRRAGGISPGIAPWGAIKETAETAYAIGCFDQKIPRHPADCAVMQAQIAGDFCPVKGGKPGGTVFEKALLPGQYLSLIHISEPTRPY